MCFVDIVEQWVAGVFAITTYISTVTLLRVCRSVRLCAIGKLQLEGVLWSTDISTVTLLRVCRSVRLCAIG